MLAPAAEFPADDLGAEFDTVGSALSLSPAYVMAYEKAAHALVDDLFAGDAARRQGIVTCDVESGGDTCAQSVLSAFARRAWRRPVTTEEVQSLLLPLTVARSLGADATVGLRHALAAVVLSPHFIFKLEIDPDPALNQARRLSPHELATRLSYALWSTMPDEELSQAADAGALASDQEVAVQVDRMLADARSSALLENFAAQWLEFRNIENHEVEARVFPRYTVALARSMKTEAQRFIEEFLRTDLPATDMFKARFTFVDSALAAPYGITRPAGSANNDFVQVDTTSLPRSGLMTLGAFLTATSFSSRTSPVKRGDFVFSRLLCGHVPPPPPGVEGLPVEVPGETMRQRLERHRADPSCAGCHTLMDPIGFGLENYDAIGAYRTQEGTAAIDSSGILPDGTPFSGAPELSAALAGDARFLPCVTQKFMTFAIGRLLNQEPDAAWIAFLAQQAAAQNGSLTSIIRSVLLSQAFRSRQPPSALATLAA